MRACADDAPAGKESEEGWDETVLVWNATVARLPAPTGEPDLAHENEAETALRGENR